MWCALLAALALLISAIAHAAAADVGRPISVCVLADAPGLSPGGLIRAPGRFDCTTEQTDFGPGDYWVISSDIAASAPVAIRVASLWQSGLDTHILYADGSVRSFPADGVGVTRRIQLGAIVEQPLPDRDVAAVRILWHVRGSANMRGILRAPRLATPAQSQRANLQMAAMYAGFGGLAFALLVYNLAVWTALRHRFQLAYCAMLVCLIVYAYSSSGALAWSFPDISNNFRLRINYLMLGLSAGTAMLFARCFFEEKLFRDWLRHAVTLAIVVPIVVGTSFFVFAPFAVDALDRLYSYSFLVVGATLIALLVRAFMLRSNYLWLFAVAWAAPFVTAVARAMHNLDLLAWNFWLDNSTILAMVAEALISSIAIAYRIRVLSRERDAAMAGEILARRLADTDPLTGLLNRRAFLDHAIGRPGEQTLLIADLDHFKRVNETLGHDGGDEVLRQFARTVRACVPASALVARIGGEEFAILTHASEPVEPEAVLARLRAARMPFDVTVTASIGACSGPLATEVDWKALYRGADAALFEAKSAGRDRSRITGSQVAA